MIYIFEEPRPKTLLSEWASGERLPCAWFYFWNVGTSLQNLQLGLLRSIFYYALSKYTELITVVFLAICRFIS
ncbi:hypothetical protein K469DRAFT_578626 [Zopfia rhizophila CBS 207.26]|uniref:Uncharacterized protein n=1 Tax=Zopfia rhizophila CBS 207.26 TaxID=1314779 RepID=A0A6A6E3U9_9PEZI|nr:hypothetical protein K469DRAFT_578626 [Zopfia rhizophila CBS 207.26]